MSPAKRRVRAAFAAFVVLNVLAVTYPGVTLFNRIDPFVFGLPFVFFWIALWVVLAFLALIVTDAIESR